MEINELLNQCMTKLDVKTDYVLAKEMGIHTALISMYRGGKREPDEYACLKIAEVLDLDAETLMVHFAARKAKNPKVKEYLQKKLADLGGIAASFFFAVNLIMTPTPSQAAPVLKSDGAILYIMSNIRRVIKAIKKTALFLVSQVSRFRELIPRVCQPTA